MTNLDADHRAEAIVESTINLAHSLGMAVVAEGVETAVVRDRLASFGCELAQGSCSRRRSRPTRFPSAPSTSPAPAPEAGSRSPRRVEIQLRPVSRPVDTGVRRISARRGPQQGGR